jgi:serine/threonine protein kinase
MPPEYYRFGPSHTLPALEVAKASDIWGIGQTLHVSLTRELIFKADLWRLEAYGCEEVPFPDHILTGHGISKASIEFLSELMAATPVHRLSVTEALAHDWCNTQPLDHTTLSWPTFCGRRHTFVLYQLARRRYERIH